MLIHITTSGISLN